MLRALAAIFTTSYPWHQGYWNGLIKESADHLPQVTVSLSMLSIFFFVPRPYKPNDVDMMTWVLSPNVQHGAVKLGL